MRAPTLLLALLLAMLSTTLTACMQTKETVKIQKNGKGTITLNTVVDKAMMEAMVEMMKGMGMGEGMGADPTAQLDPDRVNDPLYYRDDSIESYRPLDPQVQAAIASGDLKF